MISRREDWSKISKETWRFDCGGQRSCFSLFSQDESNFDPPFNWPIDNGDNSPGSKIYKGVPGLDPISSPNFSFPG